MTASAQQKPLASSHEQRVAFAPLYAWGTSRVVRQIHRGALGFEVVVIGPGIVLRSLASGGLMAWPPPPSTP